MEKGLQPNALGTGGSGTAGAVCLHRVSGTGSAPHPYDRTYALCLLTWLQVSPANCSLPACALSLALLSSSCPAQTELSPVQAVTETFLGAGDG